MKIQVVFFSGTGSTKHVAEIFKQEFVARGHSVDLCSIGKARQIVSLQYELLVICFAVHAFNAPKLVVFA